MCIFDSDTKQTSRSTTKLPAYIEETSKDVIKAAKEYVQQPYQPYTGQRVADFTADQQNAFDMARGIANQPTPYFGEAAQGFRDYGNAPAGSIDFSRLVDENGPLGKIADYINPFIQGVIDPTLREIYRSGEKQRNQIGSLATVSGAFGDARHGVLEGEQMRNEQQTVADTIAGLMSSAFDRAMQNRQADAGRAFETDVFNQRAREDALGRLFSGSTSLANLGVADTGQRLKALDALLGTGALQQTNIQQQLNALYEQFLEGKQEPLKDLNVLISALTGVPYDQSTVQVTKTDGGSSGLSGIIGSAIGGLLSDRRDKTDVEFAGRDPGTGLPLYAYRYKSDPKTYPKVVGPMAQDVEKAAPEAVKNVGGRKVITGGASDAVKTLVQNLMARKAPAAA